MAYRTVVFICNIPEEKPLKKEEKKRKRDEVTKKDEKKIRRNEEKDEILVKKKIRRREKKYICPVPGCTRRSNPLYLYQHLRVFHKMANDEMRKWKEEAKKSNEENKVPFVWLGS